MDFAQDVREFIKSTSNNRDFVNLYLMLNKRGHAFPFYRVLLNTNVVTVRQIKNVTPL
jgi:hypothetical protein